MCAATPASPDPPTRGSVLPAIAVACLLAVAGCAAPIGGQPGSSPQELSVSVEATNRGNTSLDVTVVVVPRNTTPAPFRVTYRNGSVRRFEDVAGYGALPAGSVRDAIEVVPANEDLAVHSISVPAGVNSRPVNVSHEFDRGVTVYYSVAAGDDRLLGFGATTCGYGNRLVVDLTVFAGGHLGVDADCSYYVDW